MVGTALQVCAVSPPTATHNGDTNGDGNIDISDAVYLLGFLFTGGPELASIDCPTNRPTAGVVATGQKQCYGQAGPIDCTAPKARGQDGFHQSGCPLEGRFIDNHDGTISDACTGLMWTDKQIDTDGDGELLPADFRTWLEACQFVEDMTYLGHDDWRVPNIQELLSIVNFGNTTSTSPLFFAPFDPEPLARGIQSYGGTWSSTFVEPGVRVFAVGAHGREGISCDCCVAHQIDGKELHPFLAVRGP